MDTSGNSIGVTIRTELRPGDLGFVMHRHGVLYSCEHGYGPGFEMYVGEGLIEFHRNYVPAMDQVWICEKEEKIVGFLLLMHREKGVAQLRYFYLEPEYRGLGLGNRLMQLYMDFLTGRGYLRCYLWTTRELEAAASLYVRYGFRRTAEKQSVAFGKPVTEQRYDWPAGS